MPDPVPADRAPDAATAGTVVVLNRDLLFGMRIRNAARSLGYDALVLPDTVAFVEALRTSTPTAVLAVVDMNGSVNWDQIRRVVDDPEVIVPILAFGPHVDVEGRRAAKGSGINRIVSNGEFHRSMVDLLRRYARQPGVDA